MIKRFLLATVLLGTILMASSLYAKEEAYLLVIGEGAFPGEVVITRYDSVLWLNDLSDAPLTIVFAEGAGMAGALEALSGFTTVEDTVCTDGLVSPGKTVSLRFLKPGEYRYKILGLKEEITGCVTVESEK